MADRKPDLPDPEPLLVSAEVAARLTGISERNWWSKLAQGLVPAPVRLGRRALWPVDGLRAWVAAGCPSCSD